MFPTSTLCLAQDKQRRRPKKNTEKEKRSKRVLVGNSPRSAMEL
ncbi:hypothetical protein LEP1GSC202_2744 [Leptospira yanagawae serovar Saopaulo str. Sao Paulo = ATCC 700523]|uniref:Uncharacterized protein n=1 Tax=Leptospira yanagawae serovar Saopaulo str. Sao Paulo = ATCC 700523 TaxID=1249483 RepID=A0A5E8HCT7_9LEPT|nr:hypothetical protein LEP1GSC202_2744 [Leptospira yanagawae serovar Saopaulo str. Sao Paulo = ATCC 700523]